MATHRIGDIIDERYGSQWKRWLCEKCAPRHARYLGQISGTGVRHCEGCNTTSGGLKLYDVNPQQSLAF